MAADLPPRFVPTKAAKIRILDRQGWVCAGKGCSTVFHSLRDVRCFDHRIQRWMALGPDDLRFECEENMQGLCDPCTTTKNADDAAMRGHTRRLNGETQKRPRGRRFPKGRPLEGRGFVGHRRFDNTPVWKDRRP